MSGQLVLLDIHLGQGGPVKGNSDKLVDSSEISVLTQCAFRQWFITLRRREPSVTTSSTRLARVPCSFKFLYA
eukprot:6193896-Pleurochrysis_carterae.AAC.1